MTVLVTMPGTPNRVLESSSAVKTSSKRPGCG